MTRTDVLIVGAGPTGLVSALLLARLGLRSIVVERQAATDEHPRAHELNARSLEILGQVGIDEEELAVEASPMDDAARILFCRRINEEFGRIDLEADPQRREKYARHLRQRLPYLNLSQSEFEKILVRHARRSPLVDLRQGHRWVSMEQNSEGVRSTIAADGESVVESRWLLGCDGAGSPVRKALGIEMDGPTEIQQFVNAFFRCDLASRLRTRAKLFWILDPEFAGVFVAHHVERRWVYAIPIRTPWERAEDFTPEVMRARIEGALGFPVPGLRVESLSTWRMTAQVARSYGAGRAWLLGDAAHRFPPTGGLGMNTGLADAHNLCWKLARVDAGEAGPGLLATYESERRPVAVRNCAESHANYDRIWEVIRALGLDPARADDFARLMASAPVRRLPPDLRRRLSAAIAAPARWFVGRALRPGKRAAAVAAAIDHQVDHFDRLGLDIGYVYEKGALIPDGAAPERVGRSAGDYVPTTRPGARLPHAWSADAAERVSTLDRVDYARFALFGSRARLPGLEGLASPGLEFVDTASFPEELLPADRVLLVRPDGHVAWRAGVEDVDPAAVTRAIDAVLSRPGAPGADPTS